MHTRVACNNYNMYSTSRSQCIHEWRAMITTCIVHHVHNAYTSGVQWLQHVWYITFTMHSRVACTDYNMYGTSRSQCIHEWRAMITTCMVHRVHNAYTSGVQWLQHVWYTTFTMHTHAACNDYNKYGTSIVKGKPQNFQFCLCRLLYLHI